ncbi:peptidoglycan-binding protein [Metabacillus sp. FJAT-53654]|uniref:Peptidoglycan-binding protein n=1 Tax=Metabacillus rhizosphaerae TaxID=3117747 RepID=A0ABZ2MYM7_9BACI
MTNLYYDSRNRSNLSKLANKTKVAALKWYDYCVKNNINILIYETMRTEEKQREYVNSGASQTMNSYHRVGQALDFVPVDSNGKCLWGGYGSSAIKKAIAYAKSLGFEWGGDWRRFIDKPHLQFNFKGYGTDTFSESKTVGAPKTEVKSVIVHAPKNENKISVFQSWLNTNYKAGIKVDGLYGPKTKAATLKALQTELNKQFDAQLVVDGKWGPRTKSAIRTVKKGAKGNITRIIQGMLYCLGYNPKGFDGIFGDGCESAVEVFQDDNSLSSDGIVGRNTFSKMF